MTRKPQLNQRKRVAWADRPLDWPRMTQQFRTTTSGRIMTGRHPVAKPLIQNPQDFVQNLKKAWDRCHRLEGHGASAEAVGFAFYNSLSELFARL